MDIVDSAPLRRITKTILVVDDEETLREVVQMMLEELGARTLVAQSGLDAIEIFKSKPNEIGIVVLDFSMPGLNGYQTYEQLQKENPHLRYVMVSGLRASSEISALKQNPNVAFLAKPFREEELVRVLLELEKNN